MTARSRRRYRVTLLALCCVLLAQWSLLTHACPVIRQAGDVIAQAEIAAAGAADVTANGAAKAATAAQHDCHGAAMAAAEHEPATSVLCLKHCADEGSASNGTSLAYTAAAAPPLVTRAPLATPHVPVHWERAPSCSDATAPPLSILYCVSLT
jgi:hypothetical protein